MNPNPINSQPPDNIPGQRTLAERIADAYPAAELDPALQSRVVHLADAFVDSAADRGARTPFWRSRIFRGGLAFAVALTAVSIVARPKRHGEIAPFTDVAFADVQRALTDVRTIAYTERMIGRKDSFAFPPASIFVRKSPGAFRVHNPGRDGSVNDRLERADGVSIMHSTNRTENYSIVWSPPSSEPDPYATIPVLGLPQQTLVADDCTISLEPWRSRRIVWHNRDAQEFRSGMVYRKTPKATKYTPDGRGEQLLIADARTHRVLYVQITNSLSKTIRENFRYDQPLPSDTFVLEPPVGRTVRLTDTRPRTPMTDADANAAKLLVMTALDAWSKRDWDAYRKLRHFEVNPMFDDATGRRFAQKAEIDEKARFEAYPLQRLSGTLSVTPVPGFQEVNYQRMSAQTKFPPDPIPDTFRVSGKFEVARINRGISQPATVTTQGFFTVHRFPDGSWKIVGRSFLH